MNFLKAVQFGSLEEINKIRDGLQENPSVNLVLDHKALKIAVACKRADVVELLLKKNCRVNLYTHSPLHIAAKLGNTKCVKMLLEKKASVTVVNENGDTLLHIAFQAMQMEIVDLMLNFIEQTSDYLNPKNKQDLTHLHIACIRANKAVVEGFLAVASNAISMANNHTTYQDLQATKDQQVEKIKQAPIKSSHQAASQATENKKSLMETEDVETNDSPDEDCYHFCRRKLFQSYTKETAEFHIVCGESHPDKVRRYLMTGWDVNARLKDLEWNGYPEDSTPLHCACEKYHVENAKVLLKHRANAMLMDENQATPLHIATYVNNPMEDDEMLRLLYEATKDKSVNLIDKNGMSFLHAAAAMNDLETVKLYLDQGGNVNQQIGEDEYYGVSYFTPLHFAAMYRHQDMVELLIEHGADVNSKSIDRPLHVACEFGHQGIIEVLLKKGAKGYKKAGVFEDTTALHLLLKHVAKHEWAKIYAGDCKDKEDMILKDYNRKLALVHSCMSKLLDAGCDIDAQDRDGHTALHYACATEIYNRIGVPRLLQLGADINLENEKGKTPLEMRKFDWYCGVADDFMVLYHHVQDLKALKLEVNPKNEEYCKKMMEKRAEWSKCGDWEISGQLLSDEGLAARNKQRLEEVELMKKIKLTQKVSLYSFARWDMKSSRVSAKNEMLKTILKEIYAGTGFGVYGRRIWLRWEKDLDVLQANSEAKRKSTEKDADGNVSASKRLCV